MECRDTEAMLSALHDGEAVTPEQRAANEAHCTACTSCSAFRQGLALLDRTPKPTAPAGTAERVMSALDEMVERDAIAASAGVTEFARPGDPIAPALGQPRWWLDRRRLWIAAGSVAVSAAALSLILLWGSGALSMLGGPAQDELSRQPIAATSATPGTTASLAATRSAADAAPASAPDAVAFDGRVYLPGAAVDTSGSSLTTIGVLSSSFNAMGTVVQATAYRPPLSDGSVLVRTPDGVFQYSAVIRTFDDRTWQLLSGRELMHFGQWPRLPSSFPEPTSPDGSPTFREAGKDSLTVSVYTPDGAKPTSGFAIAPGSATTDPAHGNPYWTWWVPLVKP
jgi:hypothetical protein